MSDLSDFKRTEHEPLLERHTRAVTELRERDRDTRMLRSYINEVPGWEDFDGTPSSTVGAVKLVLDQLCEQIANLQAELHEVNTEAQRYKREIAAVSMRRPREGY